MTTLTIKPQHIAIIPNGNRTWSRKNKVESWKGYWQAYTNLTKIYKNILSLDIPHLTIWAFSTENWKRNSTEVNEIFKVVEKMITYIEPILIQEKIGFHHLGRLDRIPKKLREMIIRLENETQDFLTKSFNIGLDYGGRDEIIRAINNILKTGKKEINTEIFESYLDTAGIPDPDLIIRTAGEQRLSGLMPWQSTYAEYYFSQVPFPEFNMNQMTQALNDFQLRKRTFGGDINSHNKKTDN